MADYTWEDVQTGVRRAMADRKTIRKFPALAVETVKQATLLLTGAQFEVYKQVAQNAMQREAKLFSSMTMGLDPDRVGGIAFSKIELPSIPARLSRSGLGDVLSRVLPPDLLEAMAKAVPDCNDPDCPVHGIGGLSGR